MNRITLMLVAALLVPAAQASFGPDWLVSPDEALTVARNWVALIAEQEGEWGGSATPSVDEVVELRLGERLVGYYCPVEPRGFVAVSLVRGLAPVKANSDRGMPDLVSDGGAADFLKKSMAGLLDRLERRLGALDSRTSHEVRAALDVDYSDSWSEFLGDFGAISRDYEAGEVLLSSEWHQDEPYNWECPPGDSCDYTAVGCAPLAAAQIMRYWNWPPMGDGPFIVSTYDWTYMLDQVLDWYPPEYTGAVAELCADAGDAMNAMYGCGDTGVYASDVAPALSGFFRFAPGIQSAARPDYDPGEWFDLVKDQLNRNRPVYYNVPDHAVVADGWRELGGVPIREYHINYGDGGGAQTMWYTLDALVDTMTTEENILYDVYPTTAIGPSPGGIYPKEAFEFRYFDRDAEAVYTVFAAGQRLQFLPDVVLTCSAGSVLFEGSIGDDTILSTGGDWQRGIHIDGGGLKIRPGGQMVLRGEIPEYP
jgi:hypothetical protein